MAKTAARSKAGKKTPAAASAPRKRPAQDKREIFIRQYLIHRNATRAYREAGYVDGAATRQNAHKLLTSEYVQSRIAEADAELLARLDVTVEDVVRRYRDIAFADPAQITSYRLGACRHCHGIAHRYQWRTEDEHSEAVNEAIREANRTGKNPIYPASLEGGTGYSPNVPPHEDCPMCDGRGIPSLHFKDTRLLTPAERALFAGIEQTQHGLKYRFHDQLAALAQLAERLQFFKARDDSRADALARALAEIQERGSKMPLRRDTAEGGTDGAD